MPVQESLYFFGLQSYSSIIVQRWESQSKSFQFRVDSAAHSHPSCPSLIWNLMFVTWKMGDVGLDFFRLMRVVTQLSYFQDECIIVTLSYEWSQYHHLLIELGTAMKMYSYVSCVISLLEFV